jgi:hypothetical protein
MDHEASPTENQQRRCPKCTAFSRFAHSILDSRRGITLRLYKCIACGEHLWDDDSNFFSKISTNGRAAGQSLAKPANDRSEEFSKLSGRIRPHPEASVLTIHELAANVPAPISASNTKRR